MPHTLTSRGSLSLTQPSPNLDRPSAATQGPPAHWNRHLWQIAWVRDLVWLGGLVLVLLAAYTARAIIVPILVGMALAYVFNPLVTYMERQHRWPRIATTSALLAAVYGTLLAAAAAATPILIVQSRRLFDQIGRYVEIGIERLNASVAAASADAGESADAVAGASPTFMTQLEDLDYATIADFVVRSLDIGVGVVGSVVSFATYITVAVIVITFCFFFFTWKFQPILNWFGTFIPSSQRDRTLHILGRMDRSVSAFIRGRLIQSVIMTVLLSIGWYMVGVPYWLLLGVVTGILNLIPFAGVLGFLAAIGLTIAHHLAGGESFTWWLLLGPAIVYLVAQGVDSWLVEPIVQGQATDLDPLSVLLVVLIGGSLAGLLGLILAIPIAACVKILAQEVLLPRLRHST